MTDAVKLDQVKFSYDGIHHMTFDLEVEHGTFVAVLGASGSGKSTMLSLVAGFEAVSGGKVILDGHDMTTQVPGKRPVSMVFQDNNLFAHLTVFDNVGLGLSSRLKLTDAMRSKLEEALERTGLAALQDRKPDQLSGGQRQRVALARTLVRKQPILLLDEAFASLGPGLRQDMLALVRSLHKDSRLTTIMVTHAPEDADQVADRVLFVDSGQIVWDAPTHLAFTDPSLPAVVGNYLQSTTNKNG